MAIGFGWINLGRWRGLFVGCCCILRELNVSKLRCKVMRFGCVLLCSRWRCLNGAETVECQMGIMIVRHSRLEDGRQGFGNFTFAMDATSLQLQCWSSRSATYIQTYNEGTFSGNACRREVGQTRRILYSGQHLPLHERALALHPTSMLTTRQ